MERLATLAPRPTTLAATGLSAELLGDLASKMLLRSGVLGMSTLAERLGIAGGILTDVLGLLRREARIEVRPTGNMEGELCYALTDRGRQLALDAL
jgi:DNA-binding HxlR family transcriptional regulator